jgi:hypothetical protein
VSQIREFITAVEKTEEAETTEAPGLAFMIDGQELFAYRPTEGQFALLMMALGRHASETDQFAGIIDFFINVLDAPSQRYVIDRMMGRTNIIPLSKIVEVMEWFVEEWGGRPFTSPSASTSSRRNGGRKSTGTLQPSTS